MSRQKYYKKTMMVLLTSLLVFPQSGFAAGKFNNGDLDKAVKHIQQQDKVKQDMLSLEQKSDLKDQFSTLKDGKFSSAKSSQSLKNRGDLESDFEKFRRNYNKKENNFQIMSNDKVDLKEVNDRGIIVKWQADKSFDASKYGLDHLQVSEILKKQNIYLVRVPENDDYNKKLQELKTDSNTIYAEPDYLQKSTYIPSDPQFNQQWYLEQIDMPSAWDLNQGSAGVTIAVLDSGVNANHPDLTGRVLPGYDMVNGDSNPSDDNGHGTNVAGIIASNSDSIGMAGIDFNAKILPVKVSNHNGTGSLSDSVNGIYYAIDQGADVINMSYGGYQYSSIEEDAIWEAYNNGIVLVAAAGNDGKGEWSYPASYEPVISVAATGENDQPTYFSNYGGFIDLSAPGENILSANYLGGYENIDGTSFSAPIVSALAGLVKAEHPNWSPDEIEYALENGAVQADNGEWNYDDGFGGANAYGALTATLPSLQNDTSDAISTAKVLNQDQTISDKINLPMDTDWYKFEVSQSSDVTINLTNASDHLDLVGLLYKYDGSTVLDRQKIDDNLKGEDEYYSMELDPGTYYLSIYDYYNHWSQNNYSLQMTMDTSMNDDSDLVSEVEPNDFMDTADYMPFGSMGGGYFQTYDDFDFFEVDLPYNGDIMITTATDSYAYLNDPAALLMDENGNLLDFADIFMDDDGTLKFNFISFENITAGKYYVILVNLKDYSDSHPYIFDISYSGDLVGEVPVPMASIESGTYTGAIEVELTAPEGEYIMYTLDGSEPSLTNGMRYSSPISLEKDTTLKAVSVQNEAISKVVTYDYQIDVVSLDPPYPSIRPGIFTTPFQLELKNSLLDAKIIYTLDGSAPTPDHGTLYEGPILIENDTVVNAIAVHGELITELSTFTYTYQADPDPNPVSFPDIETHWAKDDILYLAQREIVNGIPGGKFGPDDNISRASAATIIARELQLPLETTSAFSDVDPGHWAAGYIGAAAKEGFITGHEGKFKPNDPLTREEMAAILVRAYALSGSGNVAFPDVDKGSWAYPYIEKLVANDITKGVPGGMYAPKKNISRAEFATMVARVIRK